MADPCAEIRASLAFAETQIERILSLLAHGKIAKSELSVAYQQLTHWQEQRDTLLKQLHKCETDAAFSQLAHLSREYSGSNPNADGDPDINSVRADSKYRPHPRDNVVLVLVEKRLLEPLRTCRFSTDDIRGRLDRFCCDLKASPVPGRGVISPILITMDVYSKASRHQDGRVLLTMRKFMKDLRKIYLGLFGAILVGSFPEALLVRRWIWRKDHVNIRIGNTDHKDVSILAIEPEIIASRADIVLADLDGAWDSIYRPGPEMLPSMRAIPAPDMPGGTTWPSDGQPLPTRDYTRDIDPNSALGRAIQDFFWIDDAAYDEDYAADGVTLRITPRMQLRNPEVGARDRDRPNPIARPDLCISRINARHIALVPNPAIIGTDGGGLLDAAGQPRVMPLAAPLPATTHLFVRDMCFERELLIDYFDRNHEYRSHKSASQLKCASIATHSFNAHDNLQYLQAASSDLETGSVVEAATMLDYVKWLREPAIFSIIEAHSNECGSNFDSSHYDMAALEATLDASGSIPPRVWRWAWSSGRYVPGFDPDSYGTSLNLHMTMWRNRALAQTGPRIVIHRGCEVNSPAAARNRPYNDVEYGAGWDPNDRWSGNGQHAEGILFYLNALAVLARAKTSNDRPDGFPPALGAFGTVGIAWMASFECDARDAGLATLFEGAKKMYPWSLLGDWTLGLHPPAK